MAKITDLAIVDAVNGDEFLPIVQGGATKRATMAALRALIVPFLQYWYKGDKGDPGAADSVVDTLAQLKAAAISDTTRIWNGVPFTWSTDAAPYVSDETKGYVTTVASNHQPLTVGAWTRQKATGLTTSKAPGIIRSQQSQNEDGWSIFDFMGDNKRALIRAYSDSAAGECTVEVNRALASGEKIGMPAGKILVEGALIGHDGMTFLGAGMGRSIIAKPPGSRSHVLDLVGTTPKRNVHVGGFTIDVAGADAGIVMEYIEDSLFENIAMMNHPYWGINLGVIDGNDKVIRNKRIKFRNLFFDDTSLSYEHLLVFNSEDIDVDGFYGATGEDAIGIGLYQNVDRFTLRNFIIQNIKTAIYYSLSCRAIKLIDGMVRGTVSGIQGANLADNGAFGAAYAENVEISGVRFFGNRDCGLSLGALYRGNIDRCEFEGNFGPGILFDKGGIGVSGTPALERRADRIVIDRCTLRNNNRAGLPSIHAPGIAFTGTGGDMDVLIRDCSAFDDRDVPQQLYPVSFVGPYDFRGVRVQGGNLQSYGDATTIGTADGATIDVAVDQLRATPSLPVGVSGVRYTGRLAYDPPSLAAGARSAPIEVAVPGARRGDSCAVTFDQIVGEVVADGTIVSDNTAIVYLSNRSAAAIDMLPGTIIVTTLRPRKAA